MAPDNVVVAGAGPVGLVMALGLARNGIAVTVIEKDQEIGTAPRAMAYLYPVLDGFAELGVLDDIERAGFRVDSVNFVDWENHIVIGDSMAVLQGVLERPYNISLGQDVVTRILLEHLDRYPHVEVRRGCAVSGLAQDSEGVDVHVTHPDGSSEQLRAGWLVGCDGAGSAVRQHGLGLSFDGMTWPDRFVAVDLIHDFRGDGYGDANFIVHPVYGGICARIDERRWRYTFHESADLPEEDLRDRLDTFFATAIPGQDKSWELVQFSPYRMHQRSADSFRVGRVMLAGDAAHVTNPTGGLGLSGGFLDAFVLYPALAAVISGDESEDILDEYATERRRVFWDFVTPTASASKHLVFHLEDAGDRAAAMAGIAALSAHPDMRAARMLGLGQQAVTPSLIATRAARRAEQSSRPRLPKHSIERGWVGGTIVDGIAGSVPKGQMYVETLHPDESGERPPIVLVHGGGGQGLDWLVTPDGRPGWAPLLADQGYTVHVVDRPGHGRSPLSPDVYGGAAPALGAERIGAVFHPPLAGPATHPAAGLHSQWPGRPAYGDPAFDAFMSSQGPTIPDTATAQRLEQSALAALLDRIGPAVVITHSAGGPAGWLVADARPGLVSAIVGVEVIGPPFVDDPGIGVTLPWGLTAAPMTYEPAAADSAELEVEERGEGPVPVRVLTAHRKLPNLVGVPIALVTAEASPFRWFEPLVVDFLRETGCTVTSLRLWEHGVRGNAHGPMLENNNVEALAVVTEWLDHEFLPFRNMNGVNR